MFPYHDHDCFLIFSFEKQCSIECGSHGFCTEQSGQMVCQCDAGWTSSNCSIPTCSVECDNNSCDAKTRKCNCTNGYTGLCYFFLSHVGDVVAWADGYCAGL